MQPIADLTPFYIWRTQADEKVRPTHAANEGQIFSWSDSPPLTGHPGDEPGCRCWADPYEPPLDDVYPELLLIPLLRIPSLIEAWSLWKLHNNASKLWQLSKGKSDVKWANQIEQGNWTPKKITETIKNGTPHRAINKATDGPATRYQLGNRFVVRDNATGDIIQVSRPGMKPEIF